MTPVDCRWMDLARQLATLCPPRSTAFAVGVVIVDADGNELARGYSRETGPHEHAEEVALTKVAGDPRLATAILYSTLEPCSQRRSRARSCVQLILETGVPRVVMAEREPNRFVADPQGYEVLTAAGVDVLEACR